MSDVTVPSEPAKNASKDIENLPLSFSKNAKNYKLKGNDIKISTANSSETGTKSQIAEKNSNPSLTIDVKKLRASWVKNQISRQEKAKLFVRDEDEGLMRLLARHVEVNDSLWLTVVDITQGVDALISAERDCVKTPFNYRTLQRTLFSIVHGILAVIFGICIEIINFCFRKKSHSFLSPFLKGHKIASSPAANNHSLAFRHTTDSDIASQTLKSLIPPPHQPSSPSSKDAVAVLATGGDVHTPRRNLSRAWHPKQIVTIPSVIDDTADSSQFHSLHGGIRAIHTLQSQGSGRMRGGHPSHLGVIESDPLRPSAMSNLSEPSSKGVSAPLKGFSNVMICENESQKDVHEFKRSTDGHLHEHDSLTAQSGKGTAAKNDQSNHNMSDMKGDICECRESKDNNDSNGDHNEVDHENEKKSPLTYWLKRIFVWVVNPHGNDLDNSILDHDASIIQAAEQNRIETFKVLGIWDMSLTLGKSATQGGSGRRNLPQNRLQLLRKHGDSDRSIRAAQMSKLAKRLAGLEEPEDTRDATFYRDRGKVLKQECGCDDNTAVRTKSVHLMPGASNIIQNNLNSNGNNNNNQYVSSSALTLKDQASDQARASKRSSKCCMEEGIHNLGPETIGVKASALMMGVDVNFRDKDNIETTILANQHDDRDKNTLLNDDSNNIISAIRDGDSCHRHMNDIAALPNTLGCINQRNFDYANKELKEKTHEVRETARDMTPMETNPNQCGAILYGDDDNDAQKIRNNPILLRGTTKSMICHLRGSFQHFLDLLKPKKNYGSKGMRRSVFGTRVISPYHKMALTWSSGILVLDLAYAAFWIPIDLAFCTKDFGNIHRGCTQVDLFGGFLYLMNLIFGFAFGIVASHGFRRRTVLDGPLVARLYVTCGRFWLDFVASMPLLYLVVIVGLRNSGTITKDTEWVNIISIFRVIRMMRLFSVSKILYIDSMSGALQESWLGRIMNMQWLFFSFLVYHLAILVNLFACILLLTANLEGNTQSWMVSVSWVKLPKESSVYKWYCAIYWMIVTMTTTGFGDFTPQTLPEQIVVNLASLIGFTFFGVLVAAAGNFVSRATVEAFQVVASREKLQRIRDWGSTRSLPDDLKQSIEAYYSDKLSRKEDTANLDITVLESLPSSLRSKVSRCLCLPIISQVHILRELAPDIQVRLSELFRPMRLPAGEELCQQGDVADCLWILAEGCVQAVRYKEGSVTLDTRVLDNPQLFGEEILIGNIIPACQLRSWTMRTIVPSRLLRLTLQDTWPLIRMFPAIQETALEYIRFKVVRSMGCMSVDERWCGLTEVLLRLLQDKTGAAEAEQVTLELARANVEDGSLAELIGKLVSLCIQKPGTQLLIDQRTMDEIRMAAEAARENASAKRRAKTEGLYRSSRFGSKGDLACESAEGRKEEGGSSGGRGGDSEGNSREGNSREGSSRGRSNSNRKGGLDRINSSSRCIENSSNNDNNNGHRVGKGASSSSFDTSGSDETLSASTLALQLSMLLQMGASSTDLNSNPAAFAASAASMGGFPLFPRDGRFEDTSSLMSLSTNAAMGLAAYPPGCTLPIPLTVMSTTSGGENNGLFRNSNTNSNTNFNINTTTVNNPTTGLCDAPNNGKFTTAPFVDPQRQQQRNAAYFTPSSVYAPYTQNAPGLSESIPPMMMSNAPSGGSTPYFGSMPYLHPALAMVNSDIAGFQMGFPAQIPPFLPNSLAVNSVNSLDNVSAYRHLIASSSVPSTSTSSIPMMPDMAYGSAGGVDPSYPTAMMTNDVRGFTPTVGRMGGMAVPAVRGGSGRWGAGREGGGSPHVSNSDWVRKAINRTSVSRNNPYPGIARQSVWFQDDLERMSIQPGDQL
mmetsp:Transcript_5716/g.10891  ORF Transcript_5716/g.10891 Transcript_5716/m.10891 type:complete len:1840 (-) Transcript_5716:319-5838(-)|eukprot:CAMPEP_0175039648 /NCGR_PEP_ID=MMETSP0052_2-20121109/730_1 /TAXON_ID=51329 ORGANISM="Polytomella parva, Strain SAG 63-3" /NCGR_SAMPLE_ID=MMETSP0052_2 /ASSEMBLY_ACC=CAM_ASM_000194 /LENGTH=1839 /DNA_ID=CAMNT_0016301583 /DNA_START=61 /DNA_END=5580 /DNA_ORIENTATION=+